MGQSVRAMFRLFGNRVFLAYMLIQGFVMAGFFGYISASPFVLQNIYGLSAQQYALCFGFNGLGIMIFAQITGRLCTAYGDRAVLGVGAAISLFASLCVLAVGALHLPAVFMIASLFLFVSCIGITTTTSFSLAIASQTEGAGSASGLLGVTSFVFGRGHVAPRGPRRRRHLPAHGRRGRGFRSARAVLLPHGRQGASRFLPSVVALPGGWRHPPGSRFVRALRRARMRRMP